MRTQGTRTSIIQLYADMVHVILLAIAAKYDFLFWFPLHKRDHRMNIQKKRIFDVGIWARKRRRLGISALQ